MEPEETGLTFAEKVMFYILGLALLVVGGFLIFGNFNRKNQSSQNETKVTEKANEDEVKNETVSDDSATSKEDQKNSPDVDVKNGEKSESKTEEKKDEGSSAEEKSDEKSDTTKSKEEISNDSKEEQKDSTRDKTPDTRVPDTRVDDEEALDSWDLPKNIILDAYVGETIVVDKTVVNKDGSTAPAQVTVRKLEGNSYNIINVVNNRFVAQKGTYKYYYTHDSITKVATLHVEEKATNISFSTLPSFDYIENDEFTRYEFNNMMENSKGTKITKENDVYVINITKSNETNYSALLINTGEEINTIKSNTKGIYVGSEYSTLLNDYASGKARVIINMNYINSGETIRLGLKINGEIKTIDVKIIIETKKEEKEKLESDQKPVQAVETHEQEGEKPKEEIKDEVSKPSENETKPEHNKEEIVTEVEGDNDLNQSLDRT